MQLLLVYVIHDNEQGGIGFVLPTEAYVSAAGL